jgi:HAE1 family hydrophobic/amphiphilic exporter-1
MTPKDATIKAMKEVTAPVIATTLVLVAVFIPVAALGGITGRLYQQFAITVAVSVCFSSVNALTLSPALCALILRKQKPYKGLLGGFFGRFNKSFDAASEKYMSLTNVVTRKMVLGVIFVVILLGATGLVGGMVPGGFMPDEDMGYFLGNIQLPDAASRQRTDKVSAKVTKILLEQPEIEYVTEAAGYSLLSGSSAPNSGTLFVSMKEWHKRDRTVAEVVAAVNRRLYMEVYEAQAFAFGPPPIPGLGNGTGFTMVLQDLGGNTPEYLASNADRFIREANARPEIGRAMTTFRADTPQRFMEINRDKALKAGVPLDNIYTTVGAFLGGSYINDFSRFGRLYRTYIQAEPEFRQNQDQVNLFYVKNNDNESVPLSAFVDISEISGPDYTNRYNMYRSVELTGGPALGFSSTQALNALEEVAADVLPDDMSYEWSAMSYQEKAASGTAAVVFVFSLIFVFLILAAQYESWSMPFSILLGTPFAIFGAFITIYVARLFSLTYENNVFTQISLVMLIAMAAKNAILIVEFANIKFNEGLSLFEAAIEAAKLRFRPILMTAVSFILGVMPLVFASGSGAEARKVMGMSLLGGMTLATVLGVFFYPMLFVLVGKIARYEQKRELAGKSG